MKKIISLIFMAFALLFISCDNEEDVMPFPEYVSVQQRSFKFETVTVSDININFEFTITNFEPQSYSISKLQTDADGWVTNETVIKTVDISDKEPVSTITGFVPKADVFDSNVAGTKATLRLMLTSTLGNSTVAEPWLPITLSD